MGAMRLQLCVVVVALIGTVQFPAGVVADEFRPYWVQTHTPTSLWSGPTGEGIIFGPIRAWSYLRVETPQDGPRLYVWNPLTEGRAYIDALAVGPSGEPPETYLRTGTVVVRSVEQPARIIGSVRVRAEPDGDHGAGVASLGHNTGVFVLDEVVGADSESWYRIGDGEFIRGEDVRLPRLPLQRFSGRWIDADLQEPAMIALYEDDRLVDVALAVKGRTTSETLRGTFSIHRRVANETMDSATLGIPRESPRGYYLSNVLFTQYFANDGSALHFNYWSSNFGYSGSNGCLGLNYSDALFLWEWADVGTIVNIRD